MALLASWDKRYFKNEGSDWKTLIDFKYNTDIPNVLWSKPGVGSLFWKSVNWAIYASKTFNRWKVGNGEIIFLA